MQYEITGDAGTVVLSLRGHLAAADRRRFVALIPELVGGAAQSVVVDMKDLRFLDSAGLGLLLALKEAAADAGVAVRLRAASGGVLGLLKLARFETMLPIETA